MTHNCAQCQAANVTRDGLIERCGLPNCVAPSSPVVPVRPLRVIHALVSTLDDPPMQPAFEVGIDSRNEPYRL